MSVIVKLCFEDEVRRVPLGEDGKPINYAEFLRAITATFPRTEGSTLNLTWKDEDGDTITMSSDNEFTEALRCMTKNVPKFFVQTKKVEGSDRETSPKTLNPEPPVPHTTTNDVVHENVECDVCGMLPIVGVRYKSAFRADYDLCENCEKKVLPREPMIKLTESVENTPIPPNLSNILHETLGHAASVLDCLLKSEETQRVWKQCNEKAVSPFVSAVDTLVSRWTRGTPLPTVSEASASSTVSFASPSAPSCSSTTTSTTKPALKFIRDVSLPHGTEVTPGAVLRKEWLVCNDGKSAWPVGAVLCTAGGDMLLHVAETETTQTVDPPSFTPGDSVTAKTVGKTTTSTKEIPAGTPIAPPLLAGEERVLSVTLLAPLQPGRYVAYFRMKTAEGRRFGHRLWADIVVTAPSSASVAPVIPAQGSGSEESPVHDLNADTNMSVVSPSTSHVSANAASHTIQPAAISPTTVPSPSSSPFSAVEPSSSVSSVCRPDSSTSLYAQYAAAPPLYWHQELALLNEMGFTEIDVLVPLLDKFVKHPAAATPEIATEVAPSVISSTVEVPAADTAGAACTSESDSEGSVNRNNSASGGISEEKLRVAQGLQQVLAVLLGTRVTEVYI